LADYTFPDPEEPEMFGNMFDGIDHLMYGVNSQGALSQGTPEEVIADVRKCIQTLAPGGGYILGPDNSTDHRATAKSCRVRPARGPERHLTKAQNRVRMGMKTKNG